MPFYCHLSLKWQKKKKGIMGISSSNESGDKYNYMRQHVGIILHVEILKKKKKIEKGITFKYLLHC